MCYAQTQDDKTTLYILLIGLGFFAIAANFHFIHLRVEKTNPSLSAICRSVSKVAAVIGSMV